MHSFVALKSNSSIFCWGERGKGGKCDPKKNVATVTSTKGAYSALLKDGSVHSWGDIEEGGCVQPQTHASAICQPQDLNNVQAIFSTRYSFAALNKTNGEVVFYGKKVYGGSSAPATSIKSLASSSNFFALISHNGDLSIIGFNTHNVVNEPAKIDGPVKSIHSNTNAQQLGSKKFHSRIWPSWYWWRYK